MRSAARDLTGNAAEHPKSEGQDPTGRRSSRRLAPRRRRFGEVEGAAGAGRSSARAAAGLILALCLLGWVALLSVRIGSVTINTGTVLDAFVDFDGSDEHLIVRSLR
ncbi:MAG: hypothetical protein ACRDJL_09705, partial [Actinomycetota bacterium]